MINSAPIEHVIARDSRIRAITSVNGGLATARNQDLAEAACR
jgi:hypothetical protein